ncbi:hypothetical protein [Cereibacter johrii]|uniref:hypothetical protein n=1 Tax=Cereibacter johrii TaxID=445629 RepID=UPI001F266A62|nr:hypothetical protein [Cereibacter johrii]
MSQHQIELARHALGLPNRRKQSYRSHFVTGPDAPDYDAWEAMVADGFAKKFRGGQLSGGDPVFILTFEGATAALERGERLDPEDFPTQVAHG